MRREKRDAGRKGMVRVRGPEFASTYAEGRFGGRWSKSRRNRKKQGGRRNCMGECESGIVTTTLRPKSSGVTTFSWLFMVSSEWYSLQLYLVPPVLVDYTVIRNCLCLSLLGSSSAAPLFLRATYSPVRPFSLWSGYQNQEGNW